jgi:hypothetical protein
MLFPTIVKDSTLSLIAQQWKQVGYKNFNQKYTSLNSSLSEILLIKNNGTYEKHLYGNMLFTGKWKMNSDSTKIAFALTTMNGTDLPNLPLEDTKFTDSIIKLTADTFICGSLSYYGQQKIYGHNDTYYVRVK